MKGILRKKDSGWMVQYFIPPTTNQLGWINSDSKFTELPLIQEEFDINLKMKPVVELKDGKEVEFEIVDYSQKCKECGEIVERGRSCKKGCFMKSGNYTPTIKTEYAKII